MKSRLNRFHGNSCLHLAGKMAEEEQLLLRAEIFRSKLIEHFRLLDTMTDKSSEEVPKYYSDDVKSEICINSVKSFCNLGQLFSYLSNAMINSSEMIKPENVEENINSELIHGNKTLEINNLRKLWERVAIICDINEIIMKWSNPESPAQSNAIFL